MDATPEPPVNGSPAHRAPAEVLQEIFLRHPGYIAAEDPYFAHKSHKCVEGVECGPVCWAAVANVCQQWRAAALDCPALWSRLEVSISPEWMAELLHRSGNAQLQVSARLMADNVGHADSFELVLTQLSRICYLEICSAQFLRRTTVKLLAGPAPLLRTLVLDELFAAPGDRFLLVPAGGDTDILCCPALLHRDRTPRLFYLEIRRNLQDGITFNGPCSASLRCLKVSGNMMEGPLRMYSLLSLLRATPSLESLEVECAPITPSIPPLLGIHVDLPRLQLLVVTADADECALLLSCLRIPALVSLRLTARRTQTYYPLLLPLIADTLTRLPAPTILSVAGFGANPAAPGPLCLTGIQRGARVSLMTFNIVLCDCANHADAVRDALQHVELAQVHTLSVIGVRLTRRDWYAIAWPLDSVALLVVTGLYASALLPALLRVKRHVPPPDNPNALPRGMLRAPPSVAPPDSDSGEDAQEAGPVRWGRLVLPNLQDLWLAESCMSRKEEYDAGAPGAWGSALCTALRQRARVAGGGLGLVNLLRTFNTNKALLAALQDALGSKGRVRTAGLSRKDGITEPLTCETPDWANYMPRSGEL